MPGKVEQHTITPDVEASGIAFLWKQFDVRGTLGGYMDIVTCAMVTVPANALIATLPTDRMPAILDPNDWAKWLGEESATVDELKAMLRTHEGVHWTMAKEAKLASRDKATVRQSIGLF